MVKNQSLLDTLKELEDLSHIDVQDPEDEEFETGRVSTFRETVNEHNTSVKDKFDDLRKTLADDGEVDKKYSGKKTSRRDIIEWSDDDNDNDDDNDGDNGDEDDDVDEDGDDDKDDDDGESDSGNDNVEEEKYTSLVDDDDNEVDDDDDETGNFNENVNDNDNYDDILSNKLSNGNSIYEDGGVDDVEDDIDGDDEDNYNDDDDDDDDNDDEDDNENMDCTMNIDLNSIPNDLKGAASRTNDDSVLHFTAPHVDDNKLKGESTKSQLDILDKLLESRIRLQKSLHLCNQLPQHDTMPHFREDAGPQVKEAYEAAKTSMKELLNKLLQLHEKLCETNVENSAMLTTGNTTSTDPGDEEIPSDTEDEEEEGDNDGDNNNEEDKNGEKNKLNLPSKRKHTLTVAEYGEEIVKRHKALQPFQESTITKWHEKTRLASSMISNKNFASFDKSVMHQIKQVLMDKDRLIKRTQLSRVPINILGKRTNDETETEEGRTEDDVDLHLKNYDENIFDDGDFYHEMLKELIERKSNIDADDPVAAGRRWLELQKLRSKIKRKVDTRASKGRKVRYDVHTKLVSFMAPQNVGSMSNQAQNNLFASLFGQKTTTIVNG